MPGDPEMHELMQRNMQLDRESRHLAAQYRDASEEDRYEIKQEVQKIVGEQFDVRQERRTLELKRLEKDLQKLRKAVEQRKEVREKLIDRRISDLLKLEPQF